MKKQILTIVFLLSAMTSIVSAHSISLFEDLLYWRASEQTSSAWATVYTLSDTLSIVGFAAPNAYFKWSPGLRIGAKYEVSDMDLKFYWTTFGTRASGAISSTGSQIILSDFTSGFVSGNVFSSGQMKWNLRANMLDLELGHDIHPSSTARLHPFIGIRTAKIDQKIDLLWKADLFLDNFQATEQVNNNYIGIGPSLGLDSSYALHSHIDLLGNFSAAVLWGSWNINDTYSRPTSFFGLLPPSTIHINIPHTVLGTFMFKYFIGAQFTSINRSIISFAAGYEAQFWPNLLRPPTFQQLPTHGSLTLQGATCRLLIDL